VEAQTSSDECARPRRSGSALTHYMRLTVELSRATKWRRLERMVRCVLEKHGPPLKAPAAWLQDTSDRTKAKR
jgi:hypothetical protein